MTNTPDPTLDPHLAALLAVWEHRAREAPPPPCPVCGVRAGVDAAGRLMLHHDAARHAGEPVRAPSDAAVEAVKRYTGERDDDTD